MELKEAIGGTLGLISGSGKFEGEYDKLPSGLLDQLRTAKTRSELARSHKVSVSFDESHKRITITKIGTTSTTIKSSDIKEDTPKEVEPEPKEVENVEIKPYSKHTYTVPHFHADIKNALTDPAGLLIYGVGPTGSGKTEHMRLLSAELDMPLVLINCKRDMDTASFLGDKTIAIDEKTGQNYVKWQDGPVVKAMQTGLDKDGNEIGRPALLVIDEAPVMPSHIAIGLNNLLENWSSKKKLVLDGDGGRVVTSHSGFRIVMLGNTIGKGLTGLSDAGYTAQADALDLSTVDRITMIFQYGYFKKAEEKILKEKIGDNQITKQIIQIRNMIRGRIKKGDLQTPFSTRLIVALTDAFRVFKGDIAKAFYYTVFTKLLPDEKPVYNEILVSVLGKDITAEMETNAFDYM